MRRRFSILLGAGALALGLGACGGDDGGAAGTADERPTITTETTAVNPVTEQIARLKECLGGKPVTRVDVFEPTYEYAKANGGGGFAVLLRQRQVEFLVLPDPNAAQITVEDVSNQLISLQQTDPEAYAAVAATQSQALGNVVEIVPGGAPPPKVNDKIVNCISTTAEPAPET